MPANKGILIVSFGTSYPDTRRVTIDAIESTIRSAHPDIPVYSAWTSKMIIHKLAETTGEKIWTVREALTQMSSDNITDVCIQPTHITNGIENDRMKEEALELENAFSSITFGDPLITSKEDMQTIVQIIANTFRRLTDEEALILMGHGSNHHANTVYAALDYMFKEMGFPRIHVGTVEAYPTFENALNLLKKQDIRKVHLAPLMIVAGDHAANDMAGDGDDSWASMCKKAGYEVICHLKGLGEYPEIQKMFLAHLEQCCKIKTLRLAL